MPRFGEVPTAKNPLLAEFEEKRQEYTPLNRIPSSGVRRSWLPTTRTKSD